MKKTSRFSKKVENLRKAKSLSEQQAQGYNPWAAARNRGPYAKASQVYSQARKDVADAAQRAPAVARGAARMLVPGYTGVEKIRQGDTKGGLIDLGIDAATVGLASRIPGLKQGVKAGVKAATGSGVKAATTVASKTAPKARTAISNVAKNVGKAAAQNRVTQKLAGMASDISKRSGLADKANNLRQAARDRLAKAGQDTRAYRGLARKDLGNMQGGVTKGVSRQGPAKAAVMRAAKDAPLTKGAGPAGRGAKSQATVASTARKSKQQQMIIGTERSKREALKNQAAGQASRLAAKNAPLKRSAGPAGRGAGSQAAKSVKQRRANAVASKQTNQRNAMSRVKPTPIAGKTSGTPTSTRPDLQPGQAARAATGAAIAGAAITGATMTQNNAASQKMGATELQNPKIRNAIQQAKQRRTDTAVQNDRDRLQPSTAPNANRPATSSGSRPTPRPAASNTPMSVSAYAKQRASFTGKNLGGQTSVAAARNALAKKVLNTTGGGAKGNMMRQRAQRDLYGPDR